MATPLPRVCLFATFDPHTWSGGRYHALMLAAAAARDGFETHIVADHRPAFADELGLLCEHRWHLHLTADFRSSLPPGPFDVVILVPTGIFLPAFYEATLAFARQAAARLVLVNFESANWFNALAPNPRDPRLWDYWQRACLDGALVLSSSRAAHAMATRFYAADGAALRFEVWQPPVNAPACRRWDDAAGGAGVVAFVRPSDAHKGAADLLALDPLLFRGRRLDVICGTAIGGVFRERLTAHLGAAPGATVAFHTQVSDADKFRLLSGAQAVLFPSRFEGYGYPPVEAAFAGAEIVCYDLPVLRETVGPVARFAAPGDPAALGAALAEALGAPPRRAALRAAVAGFADFAQAAPLLGDILLRACAAVPVLPPRPFRAAWGPWAGTGPRSVERPPPDEPDGYLPPAVVSVTRRGPRLLVTLRVSSRGAPASAEVHQGATALLARPEAPAEAPGEAWFRWTLHLVVPAAAGPQTVRIAVGGAAPQTHCLCIAAAAPDDAALPTRCGIEGVRRTETAVIIEGWILTAAGATALQARCGQTWLPPVALSVQRPDLARVYPGYPSDRCGYVLALPAGSDPERGLELHAFARGRFDEVLEGWPPRPAGAPVAPGSDRAEDGEAPLALTLRRVTDAVWLGGVAREGTPARPAAILVARTARAGTLAPGDAVRLPSGRLRRVVEILPQAQTLRVQLDLPLSPLLDSAGRNLPVIRASPPARHGPAALSIVPRTDQDWRNGVWTVADRRYRCGVLLDAQAPDSRRVTAGAVLRFAGSGLRRVVDTAPAQEGLRVWLDGPIGPHGDGAPRALSLVQTAAGDGASLALLDEISERCTRGVACHPGAAAGTAAGRRVWLAPSAAAAALRRGDGLGFERSGQRQVLSIQRHEDAVEALLDAEVTVAGDGHPNPVRSLAAPAPRSSPVFSVPAFAAGDPAHLQLATLARRDGRALPEAGADRAADCPRILFVTPVPPLPANQGNRVVTRNLIDHLVELGFSLDVVLQGTADLAAVATRWGDRVRILQTAFPDWTATESFAARRDVLARAGRAPPTDADRFFVDAIAQLAAAYHPFFIVRDETVDLAASLYRRHAYDGIVCNYTHMLRIPVELAAIAPLPPVAVVTHDMLSRLTTEIDAVRLDTMYRPCPPAVEQACLDRLPGAVVAAISRSEADGFRQIGVSNPVVVCEYDAQEELLPYLVPAGNFDRRVLLYHGSGNPMNVAGLLWFFDHCWDTIRQGQPGAQLMVCGLVADKLPPHLPGVVYRGDLARESLLQHMRDASIAINPCRAGTGLKIKTVEACCIGLPAVCLPTAIDGLEDVAGAFAVVARDAADFIDGCVGLLTDRDRWLSLRAGALATASRRFCREFVYRELDAAMGWDAAAERRRLSPRRPGVDTWQAEPAAGDRLSLERAAVERPDDHDTAWRAGAAALRDGDGWAAAVHGGAVCAQRPEQAAGYRLVADGLSLLARPGDAADSLLQALAVEPGNQAVRAAYCAAAEAAQRSVTALRHDPFLTLPAELDREIALTSAGLANLDLAGAGLAGRPLGWGWSSPESWGTWTNGPAARLRLVLAAGAEAAAYAVIYAHAYSEPGATPAIALAADGVRIGRWLWTSGSEAHPLVATLPERPAGQREIILDVLIGTPRMAKRDHNILDPRRLGLAVRWVMLSRRPPGGALVGEPG